MNALLPGAQEILTRARTLMNVDAPDFPAQMRLALRDLCNPSYEISPNTVSDAMAASDPFDAVIHRGPPTGEDRAIPADDTATIIVIVDTLDAETFEAAYHRIARGKALTKSACRRSRR